MGLHTQPISFIGLPVVAAPVDVAGQLPLGVQLICAPWREDLCFAASARLEKAGVAKARIAKG
jgi:Asp-tRNA(Asn)/Glu-tRNA(Gln) amidotransferase A subunit family amidase